MSGAFAVDYFLDEEDIEEDDDDIVPYFSSTCIRRDRVPSVRTFYEEVLPDSYVGWPGCTHDARVFKNSNIYEELENGILNPNFHSPVSILSSYT